MPRLFPWHQTVWSGIQSRIHNQTLPHALLMSGPQGLGKLQFAQTLVQSLLCSASDAHGLGCGKCRSCQLLLADSHPDFRTVAIEEESHQIKVDQIRSLNYFMVLSHQIASYRVALISDAELLNLNAANSLLKTLEEPPPQSLIVLVTTRAALMPATLRSRCQHLRFFAPPREQSMPWLLTQVPNHDAELLLSLAHGAPLKARQLAESESLEKRASMFHDFVKMVDGDLSVLELVQRCDKLNLGEVIGWIHSWLIDIVRLHFQADTTSLTNPDLYPDLSSLCSSVDLRYLFNLQDEVLDFKRRVGTSVNRQLMLEDMLLASMEAFRPLSRET